MNRASSQTQKESSDEEGLAPLQQWVKTMMDRLLAEDFGYPDLEFSWFDDTAADPLILMQVNTGYVASGIKNRNEVRGELGLDPMPDGDEYTVTTGTGVVRLEDALAPPEPIPAPLQQHPGQPSPRLPVAANEEGSNDEKKPAAPKPKAVKKVDDDSDDHDGDHEDSLAAILLLGLRKQRDTLASKVAGTEHTGQDASSVVDAPFEDGLLNMDAIHAPVTAMLAETAQSSAHDALATLPIDNQSDLTVSITDQGITSLVNQDAVEFAGNRAAEMIGRKLVDGKLVDNPDAKWAITDTTRDGIRKLVQDAEQQGQSVQQLAQNIRESALFSPERAQRIAQWRAWIQRQQRKSDCLEAVGRRQGQALAARLGA